MCCCWESLKKLCCVSTLKMNEVIVKIVKFHESREDESTVLAAIKGQVEEFEESLVIGDFASIVFSNVGSLMNGQASPWRNAKDALGVPISARTNFKDENFGDGLIEILAFPDMLGITLENVVGGHARRIAQDSGPFKIVFQTHKDITTYINIDGRCYRLNKPKEIIIQLASESLNGKLRIAMRNTE
eukprot:TRINITY_DN10037_c0_g1_i13.p2 TRINITY_DN10037_c0_g1~~TRINITY_DN10037_c0_g1_i13.p2  ORF type:complete len:187 (-),score=55.98 TRINITY_DN10037_c0_g1_i13:126-686(-)